MLHLALMLCARRNDIDTGRIDACVSEYIRELGNILLYSVEGTGEQVAQIMREDLARRDVCLLAQSLHLLPDAISADRLSASRNE